jgi:hypothetical protein
MREGNHKLKFLKVKAIKFFRKQTKSSQFLKVNGMKSIKKTIKKYLFKKLTKNKRKIIYLLNKKKT